jgi:hypothetical protein
VRQLRLRRPRHVELCALFDRRRRRFLPVELGYVGHRVGDEFLLGFGLGYQGLYRTLDRVVAGDVRALRSDPRAHLDALYTKCPMGFAPTTITA